MSNREEIFKKIDTIIEKVNKYKKPELFDIDILERKERVVPYNLSDTEMMKILIKLIAFSQNANSKAVQDTIKKPIFDLVFANYDIQTIAKMNPCDLVDKYWNDIKGIRQQTKLFHIVMLARF